MHLKMTITRLTAALLVSSTLAAPVLAASGTVNSGGDPLRVRADPNTSSQILTKLSDGTQVEVLEQDPARMHSVEEYAAFAQTARESFPWRLTAFLRREKK